MMAARSAATLCIVLVSTIGSACGDDPVDPDPDTPEPDALAAVSGDAQTGTVGQALADPVVVEVADQNGNAMSGVTVAWDVTAGDGSVASASTSTGDDGRAGVAWTLGTTAGQNRVDATVEGLSPVTFTATAEPGAPAALVLNPDTVQVPAVGDTVRLAGSASDEYGNDVPDAVLEWTSADTAIATVDTTGLLRAEAAGQTKIVATTTGGGATDTATVVVDPKAASISISPEPVALTAAGDTVRLAVVAEDANGNAIDAVSASWSSSDDAVATVSGAGLVTAQADGTTQITATVDTASMSLSVPVTTSSGVARGWVGGDGGGATTWSNPLNWTPAGAPNGQDTTVIAAGAAAMPSLAADASVGRVEVDSGATLDIGTHTLTASGSVVALGSITGTGTLVLTGAGHNLQGAVPAIRVTGDIALDGATTVGGAVRLAGGTLRLSGFALSIRLP